MTRSLLILVAIASTSTACMHAGHAASAAAAQPASNAAAPAASPDMAGMCPMSVPGANVSAADTAGGEALTFTTTPDQVGSLREKVHAMADMHNRHHASDAAGHAARAGMSGMMGGGMAAGSMDHGMQMPPPSRATVEDLPDGARITLTPNDAADLPRLQSTVQMHAEQLQKHGCAMMEHPQHGP